MAERELLAKDWKAIPLEAKKAEVTSILTGVKVPGHLVHFAVHGISDPAANHQAILLADNSEIRASALTGSFNCGEVPRFSFVMLNACQVGTAGASLGQAAGFPGTLVRRGVLGFIAPLWEVDDKLAFEFAAAFYREAFTEGKPIGTVLHERRAVYDRAGSTTPVAYIYYGHPALRLTYGIS
jgi:CHAT domain-containing protein